MTKLVFDLEKSLQMCPPQFLYAEGPNGESWEGEPGTRFLKRHIMNRNNVMFLTVDQNKVDVNLVSNVNDIEESFTALGWDHTKPPLVYHTNSDGNKGDVGYNRFEAAKSLDWETLPFDKVEYFSFLDQEVAKCNSNAELPRKLNRWVDIVNTIKRCVDRGYVTADKLIDPEEKKLKELIVRLTKGRRKQYREFILNKYRAVDSGYATLKTWDSITASKFCGELKLPHTGTKNSENTGKVGYVKPQGTMKSLMHDCMTLIVKDKVTKDDNGNLIPIEIRGFIEDPSPEPKILKRQRIKWLRSLKSDCLDFIKVFYTKTTGLAFTYDLPIVFKGFVFQDISSNPLDDGHYMEKDIIFESWMTNELK